MSEQNRNQVQMTMYTQQVDYLEREHKDIYSEDLQTYADNIANRFKANNIGVKYVACSLHDSDTLRVWNTKIGDYVYEPKENHIHSVIRFDKRIDLDNVAKVVGDAPQNFEKPKKGRYAEENMLAYLCHAKSPDKHFYEPDRIKVSGMLPTRSSKTVLDAGTYPRYYNEHRSAWKKYRETKKVEIDRIGADELWRMVLDFKVSRRDVFENKDFFDVYVSDQSKIDKAFQARVEKRFWDLRREFDEGKFDFTSVYIYGESGSGKTTLANKLSEKLLQQGHTIYEAAATNPFDEYTGEDVVVIDDVKLNTLSPDEWLKVLDPINYSSLGARYKNKRKAFKTIIITGVFRPEVFFDKVINNVKGYDIEPLIQFVRRLIYTCQAVNGRYSLKALTQENMNADFVRVPMSDDCDTDRMANVLTQLIEYNSTDEHERTHKTMTMNDLANMSKALGMNNTLSANE